MCNGFAYDFIPEICRPEVSGEVPPLANDLASLQERAVTALNKTLAYQGRLLYNRISETVLQ